MALRGGWFGVQGDAAAREVAEAIADGLGGRTVEIARDGKALYHVGAVFASNFPIVLAQMAAELFGRAGLSSGASHAVTLALMHGALANLRATPPIDALTGPAARADARALRTHLEALDSEPDLQAARDAYTALSCLALDMARARGVEEEKIDSARSLLEAMSRFHGETEL
jgi:predicted short-subunit dehydrogenase-like oxidoreductase (DUF2520 family)